MLVTYHDIQNNQCLRYIAANLFTCVQTVNETHLPKTRVGTALNVAQTYPRCSWIFWSIPATSVVHSHTHAYMHISHTHSNTYAHTHIVLAKNIACHAKYLYRA